MFDRRTILDYLPPPFKRRPIQPPDSPFSAGSPRKRINVAEVVLPKGNKLIVHGAYAADDSTHDPVKLIKASINRLKSGPVLATIPVVTIPFSDRFPNQVTAYVGLHPSLNSPDPDDEPRCDLLDVWKKALQDANPTWEVAWAPATEGTDKRMWTRYPTFVPDLARKLDREPTKDETVKCLLDILKANKIAVERAFALGTNGAAAILIHPRQADTILRQRSVNSHSFLPDKLQVDHVRQIEIEQPFELVVAGLSAYEQLDQLIIGYLSEFVDEGGDLLAGWRSPEGHRDLLVFHMATWTAAKHILNDHKNFQETFSKYQLTPPELVFSMNDGAVPWKVTNTVVEEAGKIGTQIDKLTHRFDKVERDVGVRLDATHAIVADVQKSTGYLTDQVANLATTQQHTNLALISMQREVALTRQRAPLEVAESSLRMLVMLGGMEEEKNEVRKNIETLKAEKARIDAQIDVLQGSTLALPPPPPRAPAPIPCTPPGLPATPTNSQSVQHGTSSRQPSPLSPTDPVNSSPRTPTQHDTEGEKAHKHRRLSNEADGDITEEKEVSEFAQPEQDTSMDDAPAMESLRTSQAINRCYAEAKGDVTLSAFANKLKHEAYKALFAVQAEEVKARAAYRDKSQIMAALCVVNALDSDVLIGDPDGVKDNAQMKDLRALLCKGNARPAPGPDEWEKWVVKNLSDQSLALILQLVNYIVINSTFPGDIKDTTLAMFHKCGLRTDLSNWCGIFLSNFIANCPITWLNSLLTPYISKLRILPDTQVAMQQDVQTRDLMSYLAGIKCWAVRQKVLFFAVKRDQKKGFDYLSPVGLHDAACVYGFPQQIIDIDIASQTDVRCFIWMAHGITEPITISGVNKQGGPMLPLKSTLTTSLGHHYLNDLLANDPDALILTTASFKKADPHLPDDRLKLHVAMTEATDDSYIFAKSLPSLRRNTLEMERFQFAYGWLTQWMKTMAYTIQASGNLPAKITFDSVTDQRGVDPMIVTQHEVPLIRDELDFLRAKVDNPTARYEELKAFINAFSFPKALLLLQPIKQSDTEELNRKIMRKVHDKLGMPFTPNTKILNLPLKFHGLEFPSIARINAGIAIDGLARDLNHHIPVYHTMARITMADWTCMINNWIDPIDEMGLRTDFSHYPSKIPYGWIVTQKVMGSVTPRLSLRITERAEILRDPGNAPTARRQ
ncbi:hypothetical protein B0H10DRAFT_2219845 [Mycena sp. CBHHK59/15]|nr:hypothetical protein B0H10DRAFT_2219845 [Mycena sp. CBHHK59/15]